MIKIGIECENLEDPKSRWGIGQITFNLLREYVKNQEWHEKYKLYLYFKKRIPDDEILKDPIFTKRVLGFPSFNVFYHILMPIRAMIDRVDWMFFPAYQLPPLYIGKSIVVLTPDAYYEYKYGDLPFRYKLAYRIFTNWAAKFATKIMAISETSKKNLVKLYGIKPERIVVNYLGINFRPNLESRIWNLESEQNSKFQIPNSYILFVGQAFPRRHLKETILAFEKIKTSYSQILQSSFDRLKHDQETTPRKNLGISDLKLVIVGPDKYKVPTINLLAEKVNKQLGREAITHKDYVSNEELTELYSGAKALVYVSDREAFGLPPMEASSFGVPPIVMDNELGHELFGEYAFYSKSGNVDDIAEAIKQVLSEEGPAAELRARIKNSGLEFVKKYNWKSFADRFLEIVKKLNRARQGS